MNTGKSNVAISVEKIVKRYGDFTAVDGITFHVDDGEIFGLLGPNGAGKSTLIRMMTTLTPVTSGRAVVSGHDVSREPDAVRRTIGVIPQALTSDIDLTVEENLSIYAKLYEVPKADREKNINDLLEAVDLVKWRDAQTKTLSGGMRRQAGDCSRPGSQSSNLFPGRTDDGTGSSIARCGLGDAEPFEKYAQPDHAADHALYG